MRLIARFAQEQEECFEIITVYDLRVVKERINKITPALVSIAHEYPTALWFERKITDDFGIEILYSNDKRPLLKHEHFPKNLYPMRKSYRKVSIESVVEDSKPVNENHGVILGPTHPYHLDSSQFQLFDRNYEILHFETMPFYKYRGIEKMLEGLTLDDAKPIVERISGNMSIAYQTAYLNIQLQAAKKELPKIVKQRHIFLLELERIINHLYDLAVMSQFADFSEGSYFFMKLVEQGRAVMRDLTGHRFGFDAVNPNTNFIETDACYDFLFYLEKELAWFETWIKAIPSFWNSLIEVGQLSKEDTLSYGLVGIMARSVDIGLDRRMQNKLYTQSDFYISSEDTGDSAARFKIRLTEIYSSIRIMRKLFPNHNLPFFLGTVMNGEYYSYVESSAGELMMYVALKEGKIDRFFVRDPSFLNAQVLSECLKGNEVSSLGLIIKSVPLSFSANDL
ncbi:NADH-quinone oxidoreductase subunit C [bacterium]|nr:NADH-quinone oxidoreductase subunit C [bacterium]MBU1958862.1 NADH-quinone oxidoreductase subunit C [bacterium]